MEYVLYGNQIKKKCTKTHSQISIVLTAKLSEYDIGIYVTQKLFMYSITCVSAYSKRGILLKSHEIIFIGLIIRIHLGRFTLN
jgi:hypothetical protein